MGQLDKCAPICKNDRDPDLQDRPPASRALRLAGSLCKLGNEPRRPFTRNASSRRLFWRLGGRRGAEKVQSAPGCIYTSHWRRRSSQAGGRNRSNKAVQLCANTRARLVRSARPRAGGRESCADLRASPPKSARPFWQKISRSHRAGAHFRLELARAPASGGGQWRRPARAGLSLSCLPMFSKCPAPLRSGRQGPPSSAHQPASGGAQTMTGTDSSSSAHLSTRHALERAQEVREF